MPEPSPQPSTGVEPSAEAARIVLLEDALNQAVHTIEFMHGCLTDDRFEYAYPQMTAERVAAIRALVPERPGCVHGRHVEGCEACEAHIHRVKTTTAARGAIHAAGVLEGRAAMRDEIVEWLREQVNTRPRQGALIRLFDRFEAAFPTTGEKPIDPPKRGDARPHASPEET